MKKYLLSRWGPISLASAMMMVFGVGVIEMANAENEVSVQNCSECHYVTFEETDLSARPIGDASPTIFILSEKENAQTPDTDGTAVLCDYSESSDTATNMVALKEVDPAENVSNDNDEPSIVYIV